MEIDKDSWNNLAQNNQKLNSMQPLILHELERLSSCYSELDKKVDRIDKILSVDIAQLKIKAGVWGAMGGAIPAGVALLVYFAKQIVK